MIGAAGEAGGAVRRYGLHRRFDQSSPRATEALRADGM